MVDIATLADALQRVVVGLASRLEVGREIQQWLGETVADDEEEDDEKPSKTAVAIEERVDRLELVVQECRLNERGQLGILVDEPLEVTQQARELLWGWGNEGGGFDRGTSGPDPVLCRTEIAGLTVTTLGHQRGARRASHEGAAR